MNYKTATVSELHDALTSGKTTSKQLTQEALSIIKEKDGEINAFIEVFPSALEDAERADKMIKDGKATYFTGIPISIKDNICIKDRGLTAGSKILDSFISPYDAEVIEKLKRVGAVIIGRTNMDEFAMGSTGETSFYGVTKNPEDVSRVCGGSSSGSAASVSMGAVPISLGSDTGGSVRQPASFCKLVGFKPTYGSVSRYGLIALASSLDVIGPIARSTKDAEEMFKLINGSKKDNTANIFEKITGPQKTVGVPKLNNISEETMKLFNKTIEVLKEKGYEIKEIDLPTNAVPVYYIIQPAEASSNLSRYDGVKYGLHLEGKDLWEDYINTREGGFGKEVRRRIVLGTYVLSVGYYDKYYKKATEVRNKIREEYINVLEDCEVIIMPTTSDVAFKIGEMDDPIKAYTEDHLTVQANLTGLPAISIPMNKEGLGRGVQIIGGYNNEEAIFKCAKDIEM